MAEFNLKERMEELKIKKTHTAKMLGVTPQCLNNWMTRNSVPKTHMQSMAAILSVPVNKLIHNKESKKQKNTCKIIQISIQENEQELLTRFLSVSGNTHKEKLKYLLELTHTL